MSKILYILSLITLAWTAISFAGLPLWMFFTRRNRRYHRANNWADDFQFDVDRHPPSNAPVCTNPPPAPVRIGAIHQVRA